MESSIIKNVSKDYPNIAWWIEDETIEITNEYGKGIVARAIDEGGAVYEKEKCVDFNHAMDALERGIKKWHDENM